MSTLFAEILPMFTNEFERVAAEALNYVLNDSAAARLQLEKMLLCAGAEVGPISKTRTEVSHEKHGRVDLVAYDREGRERALVELKFWADLTDHQPNGYLARLDPNASTVLLFVCPESRTEALWTEILGRCNRKFCVEVISGNTVIRTAAVGDGPRRLALTSWQHLLTTIADGRSELDKFNIEQVEGLVANMEKSKFVPWEDVDLRQDIPLKISGLRAIIGGAVERATSNDWGIAEQTSRVSGGIECGQYLFLGGVGVWFGVDFHSWAEHADSPLWVQFNHNDLPQDGNALRRLKRNQTIRKFEVDEHYYHFPIDLPIAGDFSGVVKSVVKQLNGIARLIDPGTKRYR